MGHPGQHPGDLAANRSRSPGIPKRDFESLQEGRTLGHEGLPGHLPEGADGQGPDHGCIELPSPDQAGASESSAGHGRIPVFQKGGEDRGSAGVTVEEPCRKRDLFPDLRGFVGSRSVDGARSGPGSRRIPGSRGVPVSSRSRASGWRPIPRVPHRQLVDEETSQGSPLLLHESTPQEAGEGRVPLLPLRRGQNLTDDRGRLVGGGGQGRHGLFPDERGGVIQTRANPLHGYESREATQQAKDPTADLGRRMVQEHLQLVGQGPGIDGAGLLHEVQPEDHVHRVAPEGVLHQRQGAPLGQARESVSEAREAALDGFGQGRHVFPLRPESQESPDPGQAGGRPRHLLIVEEEEKDPDQPPGDGLSEPLLDGHVDIGLGLELQLRRERHIEDLPPRALRGIPEGGVGCLRHRRHPDAEGGGEGEGRAQHHQGKHEDRQADPPAPEKGSQGNQDDDGQPVDGPEYVSLERADGVQVAGVRRHGLVELVVHERLHQHRDQHQSRDELDVPMGEDPDELGGRESRVPVPHLPSGTSDGWVSLPYDRKGDGEGRHEDGGQDEKVGRAHRLGQDPRRDPSQRRSTRSRGDDQGNGRLRVPAVEEDLDRHEELGHQRGGEEIVPPVEDHPQKRASLGVEEAKEEERQGEAAGGGRNESLPRNPIRKVVDGGSEEDDDGTDQVDLVELALGQPVQGQGVLDGTEDPDGEQNQEIESHHRQESAKLPSVPGQGIRKESAEGVDGCDSVRGGGTRNRRPITRGSKCLELGPEARLSLEDEDLERRAPDERSLSLRETSCRL